MKLKHKTIAKKSKSKISGAQFRQMQSEMKKAAGDTGMSFLEYLDELSDLFFGPPHDDEQEIN